MQKLLFISFISIFFTSCSSNWGWYVINPTLPGGYINVKFLLSGLWYTIILSITAISISIVLGLIVALPGISSNKTFKGFNRFYVEIMRSVPILVHIVGLLWASTDNEYINRSVLGWSNSSFIV